jgi:hypothetical protein
MNNEIANTETENEILAAKLLDAETPSYVVSVDPDEAESMGAFKEDALSEDDALASSIDGN